MPAPRAPWWLYLIAASFFGFFIFQIYVYIWGPGWIGFRSDYHNGSMFLRTISPEGPFARAGLRVGDRIIAMDGISIHGEKELYRAYANFEPGRPIQIKIEREGKPLEFTVSLSRGSLRDMGWADWESIGAAAFTFVLALVIGVRRPYDSVARISAWLLASMAFDTASADYGEAPIWRHLPIALGLLLWPGWISRCVISGLSITFAIAFPRQLLRKAWAWTLIWLPVAFAAVLQTLLYVRLVYQPTTSNPLDAVNPHLMSSALSLCYVPATLLVLGFQYRRLQDLNEKRRMRVLFAGALLCCLAVSTINVMRLLFLAQLTDAVFAALLTLYFAGPVALAYAVLRHRVFDLGIIFRLGLQYLLARRLLISAVPMMAAVLLADLFIHGDQPMLAVFRARGWMYAALAALAAIAYTQRQNWLDQLDRRFFREHYDARGILREVVEEVHAAKTFEEEAPRAVAHIEAALHPEFAELLVCQPHEAYYRTLAVAPAGRSSPPLQKEGKLLSLIRLLGKPLELPQTESGWLLQQLPHEETEFLRKARIDLLVPVNTDPLHTQALLALGAKRSEEPYSGEDQDLLVTIAASLAILLEKPFAASRTDIFEECPKCGVCYDSGATQCTKDAARLLPVILPRLLHTRYRLERRLGRGGMGTVYAASDISLARRVAVKVIREDLVGSPEAAERFRQEARAAASFAHPNVVTVHDFGVAAGTRAFLVMEILEGSTLRERLRMQKRLPPARVVSIIREVSAALGAAHRRQLVHRDLKPENLFLVATESGEITKVLDFGLAKFMPSNSTEQRTVDTAPGAVLGTPRYMSPEQRFGGAVHQAWDLWALAVVTYEMLTGTFPFEDSLPSDWSAAASSVPFTPVTKYLPDEGCRWQGLFERSFARELSCRHVSADDFLSEVQSVPL